MRSHDVDMDSKDYLKEFAELYPFAMVDFEIPESHINDATDGEFHVPERKDYHTYAEPQECSMCADLEERIAELERQLAYERSLNT